MRILLCFIQSLLSGSKFDLLIASAANESCEYASKVASLAGFSSRNWFRCGRRLLCRARNAKDQKQEIEALAQRVEHPHGLIPFSFLYGDSGDTRQRLPRYFFFTGPAAAGTGLSAWASSRLTCHIWVSVRMLL